MTSFVAACWGVSRACLLVDFTTSPGDMRAVIQPCVKLPRRPAWRGYLLPSFLPLDPNSSRNGSPGIRSETTDTPIRRPGHLNTCPGWTSLAIARIHHAFVERSRACLLVDFTTWPGDTSYACSAVIQPYVSKRRDVAMPACGGLSSLLCLNPNSDRNGPPGTMIW